MQATLGLSYKHLWFDQYCIPPDSIDLQYRLTVTDLAHRQAAVTIVAAAGIEADPGLAEISLLRSCKHEFALMAELGSLVLRISKF